MKESRLLFVYNADSGAINALFDIAHKLFSPKTYSCDLCMVTHGHLKMREQWQEAQQSLEQAGLEITYLHRDEFLRKHYMPTTDLPAVLLKSAEGTTVLLSPQDISDCKTPTQLVEAIQSKLDR